MPTLHTSRGVFYVADYRRPPTATPPTVLIHGAGGAHMDMPVPLRRNTALQPIAPDLNGHGRSHGDGQPSIEAYALDVLTVLDAMHIPQANVLGHSMGGAIALQMALMAPQQVARLILVGTGPYIPVNPDIIRGFQTDAVATAAMIARWMWPKGTSEAIIAQSAARMTETRAEVIVNDYIACNGFDVREKLSEIIQPTLIVHGGLDRMVRMDDARSMATQMPHAQILEYPSAGHMVHLEEADAVSAGIDRWLATSR